MSIISDLVNVEEFDKINYFVEERWDVSFYCKDCNGIVETNRPNEKGYIFICNKCKGKNIAIWTSESIKTHYRIKD